MSPLPLLRGTIANSTTWVVAQQLKGMSTVMKTTVSTARQSHPFYRNSSLLTTIFPTTTSRCNNYNRHVQRTYATTTNPTATTTTINSAEAASTATASAQLTDGEMEMEEVPVAIIGAGPVGLTLSMLLARHGVRSIVLEQRLHATEHPQAHFINTRSMEIFREVGGHELEQRIREAAPPLDTWRQFIYCRSLLGPKDEALLGVDDHYAAQPWPRLPPINRSNKNNNSSSSSSNRDNDVARVGDGEPALNLLARLSATAPVHLAQTHLQPILTEEARERGIDVRYGARFAGLQQDATGVTITFNGQEQQHRHHHQHKQPSTTASVRASYVIGADGAGSSVRQAADLSLGSARDLQDLVNVHFFSSELAARLSAAGREAMLYFIWNREAIGVLVAHDLRPGRGEFVLQLPYFPPLERVPDHYTPKDCQRIVEALAGAPDLPPIDVRNVQGWKMSAAVAETYRSDRVILAGDACHIFPPAGAFGMNTGLADAHALAWRLSAALQQQKQQQQSDHHRVSAAAATNNLLDTYVNERRAVAQRTADVAVSNVERVWRISSLLGLNRGVGQAVVDAFRTGPLAAVLPEAAASDLARNIMGAGRAAADVVPATSRAIAGTMRRRVARLLAAGEGLGMLFLGQDLGVVYGGDRGRGDHPNSTTAAAAPDQCGFGAPTLYSPSVETGVRMPHFWLHVIPDASAFKGHDSNAGPAGTAPVASHDIVAHAQLVVEHNTDQDNKNESKNNPGPAFVLFDFLGNGSDGPRCDQRLLGYRLVPVRCAPSAEHSLPQCLKGVVALLVRPDGHVASAWSQFPSSSDLETAIGRIL